MTAFIFRPLILRNTPIPISNTPRELQHAATSPRPRKTQLFNVSFVFPGKTYLLSIFPLSLALSSRFPHQLRTESFLGLVLVHRRHGRLKEEGNQGGAIREPVPWELYP